MITNYSLCTLAVKLNKRLYKYEPIIATSVHCSYCYARDTIKGRFELAENKISKHPYFAFAYATLCLKSRFKLGELVIKDTEYQEVYEHHFNCKL
jgi:hypothetical protein